jgi:pSer/pThr/pTyr-binding forkhead associated (FHA) protein
VRLQLSIRARRGRARDGDDAGDTFERRVEVPFDGEAIVIGRAPGLEVELPFPSVSARHARIARDVGGLRVQDLGSANGTWLGARRLPSGSVDRVAVGDTLRLAEVEVVIEAELADDSDDPTPQSSATFARCLVHDLFATCPPAESVRLAVLGGEFDGRELPLSASGRPFKVGRCERCDLVLPDEAVSREHAAFERGLEGVLLRDLGSKNGIEVDGVLVKGASLLHDGDTVRIGEVRFRLIDPEDRYLRQVQAAADVPAEQSTSNGMSARSTKAKGAERAVGRLPWLASAVAGLVLLLVLACVLALAFAA